jgi:hypothetical protein
MACFRYESSAGGTIVVSNFRVSQSRGIKDTAIDTAPGSTRI